MNIPNSNIKADHKNTESYFLKKKAPEYINEPKS